MRKLKGIIINGEWLGENVVVNGMFRTISSMAPFVMLEFVKLINQIDKLDEAVAIKKFNFLDNNSIEIEFTNSQIDGMADLYFRLHNGIPELTDKNLTFFAQNPPIEEAEPKVSEEECAVKDVEKTFEKLSTETIDPKEDNTISDAKTSEETEDVAKVEDASSISEDKIEENPEDVIADLYEEEIQAEEIKHEPAVAENMTETIAKTQDAISMLLNDLAKNAQKIPPVQIQVVQAPTQQATVEQEISEPKAQTAPKATVQENIDTENKIKEPEKIIPSDVSASLVTEPEFNKEDSIEEPVFKDEPEEATTAEEAVEETFAESNDVDTIELEDVESEESENFKEEEIVALEELPAEIEAIAETEIASENKGESDPETDEIEESKKEVNSDINEDEIQECLAGFYEAPKNNEIEEICTQNPDNIVMQAMLNEMLILKEELNKLKEEPKKPEIASFWSDNDKKLNYIEDDEADFRIMGSEKRINASILDEDMFVAGDKLYKWGDMLYLDE